MTHKDYYFFLSNHQEKTATVTPTRIGAIIALNSNDSIKSPPDNCSLIWAVPFIIIASQLQKKGFFKCDVWI